jgi:hypothetical protein
LYATYLLNRIAGTVIMNKDIIDKGPLEEITAGDLGRMKKYVGIFLDGLPGYMEQIRNATSERNREKMYQVMHAIKPHIKMMGMVKLLPDIDRREERFTEGISDDDFRIESDRVVEILEEASVELQKFVQDKD